MRPRLLRRRLREPPGDLEAQWEHIRLLERLPQPGSRGGVALEQVREAMRARRELAPLRQWERISDSSFKTYTNGANHVRLRRLLEFVRDGDRVLDVGIGFGYVTGVLLRERRLEHYCGIDLKDQFLAAVESMAARNDLDTSPVHLEVKDVTDVTREWMEPHRPDVVLVLEMLEHVREPERALAALARAIPPDATVLVTVPLLGRMEGVWGHVSLFDRGRIEEMCEHAGLVLHHVEPLYATWILMAVSPGAETPSRLAPVIAGSRPASRRLRLAAEALPTPEYPSHTVEQVPVGARYDYARAQDDPAHVSVKGRLIGVFCEVRAAELASATGGVRLPMTEPAFTRLQLSFTDSAHVEEVRVTAVDGQGRARVTWTWDGGRRPIRDRPVTHVLRAGRATPYFLAGGAGDTSGVVALELEMRVRRGQSATFRLHRAAFLGPAG